MNKLIFFILAIVLIGGGWYYWQKPAMAPVVDTSSDTATTTPEDTAASTTVSVGVSLLPKVTVNMTDAGFSPNTITVKKGQMVEFVNTGKDFHWPASDLHPTHEIYSEFDADKPIGPGDSYSFAFGKVGKWNMHDHLHASFRGVVTVEE